MVAALIVVGKDEGWVTKRVRVAWQLQWWQGWQGSNSNGNKQGSDNGNKGVKQG
jgi:hypothetical protein